MSIVAELKRRNVFRVGAAYAVVGWLLVEVSDTVFPRIGLPDWSVTFVIALVMVGFPLALFLAWAFELTPDGVKRSDEVPTPTSVTPHTGRRIDRLIVIALAAVILVMGIERIWFAGGATESAEVSAAGMDAPLATNALRSIAVLAFEDLSPGQDQAYFAEGISEELLNLLSRGGDLRVAARTSSFQFKGTSTDIREIGQALNVETVLEGSVRKDGEQIRVTAQLIEVGSGFHLWSENFDRRLESIFTVQDEIASAIVRALRLRLDLDREAAPHASSVEAYDHYLRGRQQAREPTRAGLLRAIEQYERAIGLDPTFAAAYSGIADAWVWLEDYGGVPSAEAFAHAERAARRALDLDPRSAEALAAMGLVLDRFYSDSYGAEEYFERALRINPNHVGTYNLYGDVLRDLGRTRRMIEVHQAAVELDPLSIFMRTRLAAKLITAGRLDDAMRVLNDVFAESPDDPYAREELGNLHLRQGRLVEALREYRAVHDARPGDPFSAAQSAMVATSLGDEPLARAWIAAARARGEDNRWELTAVSTQAQAAGDWELLARTGAMRGGIIGSWEQGIAAARRESWSEARRHLLEALQRSSYEPGRGVSLKQVGPLVELAWVEKMLAVPGWRERSASARLFLESLRSENPDFSGTLLGATFPDHLLARNAALEGDRAATLGHLRSLARMEFTMPWMIEMDPVLAEWRDDSDFRAILQDMHDRIAAERAKVSHRELLP